METIHQQQLSENTIKDQGLNNQYIDCSQIIYKNFAIKPIQSFLGISIQNEKMYVVQKKSISVFQYFADPSSQKIGFSGFHQLNTHKVPSLVKEIFLPFQISKYIITQKYICVKSKNKTQIRDNQFQTVYYSQNNGILTTRNKAQNQELLSQNSFSYDTVEQLQLQCEIINDDMVSWKVVMKRKTNSSDPRYLREYWSEKINISTKNRSIIKCRCQIIDPSNKNRKIQICKPPLFVNQLGYIQNFYIWPFTSNDIQIGIYFNHKQHQNLTENALYEICSFQLKQSNIKNVFYLDFKGTSSTQRNKDGPHLFFAVCQNPSKQKSKIKVIIFEVLPEQKIGNQQQSQNEALNNYLDQFNQLRKQKKSQQSISNNILLNELLQSDEKSGSNPNKPTTIIESFTLKESSSFRKAFYNPKSKVLWIDDTAQVAYRIKFAQSGDIKLFRQLNRSFVDRIQQYRNDNTAPQLEGIMFDNYPIYKHKAISLQIGLRGPTLRQKQQVMALQNNQSQQKQKQVIQFDDKQLQKMDQQEREKPVNIENKEQTRANKRQTRDRASQGTDQGQARKDESHPQKIAKLLKCQQTQTQLQEPQKGKAVSQPQKQLRVQSVPQLLKQLNFEKIQDTLIRFSSLFSASVTKNINKLKEVNNKAKEQIKLKINADIFDLIKQVFTPMMGDVLGDKIQKEVAKSREFVQKIFNKHIQHFNLLLGEEKIKEQNIKRSIIEEQIRSIDVIKEASFKFFDIAKIRQMQKIAYNQVVVQSIHQVGQKIESLQTKFNQMSQQSQQAERKIFQQVKQIKETFKLLIQLDKDEKQGKQSNVSGESQSSDSGFESGEQSQASEQVQNDHVDHKRFQQRRMPYNSRVESTYRPIYAPPNMIPYSQRSHNWNSYNQGQANFSYPPPPPQVYQNSQMPLNYPQQPYSNMQPNYLPPQNYQNQNMIMPSQYHNYYPTPPYQTIHPEFDQVKQQVNPSYKHEKKKRKHSLKGKPSSSMVHKD